MNIKINDFEYLFVQNMRWKFSDTSYFITNSQISSHNIIYSKLHKLESKLHCLYMTLLKDQNFDFSDTEGFTNFKFGMVVTY